VKVCVPVSGAVRTEIRLMASGSERHVSVVRVTGLSLPMVPGASVVVTRVPAASMPSTVFVPRFSTSTVCRAV